MAQLFESCEPIEDINSDGFVSYETSSEFDIIQPTNENTLKILKKVLKNLESFNKPNKVTEFCPSDRIVVDDHTEESSFLEKLSQYVERQLVFIEHEMNLSENEEEEVRLYKTSVLSEVQGAKRKKVDIIKPTDEKVLLEQCRVISEGYKVSMSVDYSQWKPHPRFDKHVQHFVLKRKHKNGTIYAVAKEESEAKVKKKIEVSQAIADAVDSKNEDMTAKGRNQKRKRGAKKKKQKTISTVGMEGVAPESL